MFENDSLKEIVVQLRAINYLLQDALRVLRDLDERMPYCSCKDEHAVGDTWTCLFHGTVTKVG